MTTKKKNYKVYHHKSIIAMFRCFDVCTKYIDCKNFIARRMIILLGKRRKGLGGRGRVSGCGAAVSVNPVGGVIPLAHTISVFFLGCV